jgi:uncharacterized protein (DUF983 family)
MSTLAIYTLVIGMWNAAGVVLFGSMPWKQPTWVSFGVAVVCLVIYLMETKEVQRK